MNRLAWTRKISIFAVIETLLTLASLTLVAIAVGGQVGEMIGLHGKAGTGVGWAIAIVFDALWIGALRMSEQAIRQRSTVGMTVMLGLSAVAIGVSSTILLMLGHAKVFAFVPVAAALFMGLRLFAGNVLADKETAERIGKQSAADRNARALAAADARHLRSQATTEVYLETAGHLAEMGRQIAQSEVLTTAQKQIDKARAKAEERLRNSDKKHSEDAQKFLSRNLLTSVSRPAVTADGDTPAELEGHTVVTQATPEIETVTTPPVTAPEIVVAETVDMAVEQAPVENPMVLSELADAAGVPVPKQGEKLSNEQLDVVLRWLRYDMDPPRSYRQAQDEFRSRGFQAREQRIRQAWAEIEERETGALTH